MGSGKSGSSRIALLDPVLRSWKTPAGVGNLVNSNELRLRCPRLSQTEEEKSVAECEGARFDRIERA